MYDSGTAINPAVSIEKTFTRSGCKQESSVIGNLATIKLVPYIPSSADVLTKASYAMGGWAVVQEIYGFSHFTLTTGDYHDISFCKVARLSSSVRC